MPSAHLLVQLWDYHETAGLTRNYGNENPWKPNKARINEHLVPIFKLLTLSQECLVTHHQMKNS